MFALTCSNAAPETLTSLRRLVASRWLVLLMLAASTLLAPLLLAIPLPQAALWSIVALALAFNTLAYLRLKNAENAASCELFSQLLFDIATLSAVVFFSGGATNPLVSLLLPPVAIAALTLPGRQALLIALAAIVAYSALMRFYLPLPISDASRATRLHLIGMWLIFVVSAAMIAWLIMRMTQQIRERDAALAAAREQALRDERVMAMGTLAAGAAHELGTPLATMNLIVGELVDDPQLAPAIREDMALLRQQIGVCKHIITGLSRRAGVERLENTDRQPVDRWLDAVRQHWHALRPAVSSQLIVASEPPTPLIATDPRLEQAVLNLLNNAANAQGESQQALAIKVCWCDEKICIDIRDQGPGFPPSVLAQGGLSGFPAHAGGSGVGLVLTRAAIMQLGGQLRLSNPESGGAQARIELPRTQP